MITLDVLRHFFGGSKASTKYWLATILLLSNFTAYSTYTVIGCVSDDTGYLYTNPSGVNSPRGYSYGPAYETNAVITSGQIGTGMYCRPTDLGNCVIRTKSKCTECTGPYDYKPGSGTDYYYEQAGQLTGYVLCPIDDYAGLLLVLVGGISFYFLRRRRLAMTP